MIDRWLSFSQMKTWHECRRQWAYKYRDGYSLKLPRFDFMRGSLLHYGMENTALVEQESLLDLAWGLAVDAWTDEWEPEKRDMMMPPGWFDECKQIVLGARDVFRQEWEPVWLPDADGDWAPLLEVKMYTPLPDFYKGVIFIPDVVAIKKTDPFKGGLFAVDFKSYSKPKPQDAGLYDLQGAIYQRGLRSHGLDAIGTCLFQLATEGRKPVRIRKDGQPYQGDQERYDNWKAVSGQIITHRSEDFLDGVWEQIVLPTALEMHDAERAGDLTLVPTMDYYRCSYCDFRNACQARLKKDDEAEILAADFNRRERRQRGEKSAEGIQA